jgi:hypothetical protein
MEAYILIRANFLEIHTYVCGIVPTIMGKELLGTQYYLNVGATCAPSHAGGGEGTAWHSTVH